MNLLHSIKAHADDSLINVVIEIPTGSQAKIEYDGDKEIFAVDRLLYTKLPYPFNYGFIPETWEADGDPLDAMVISSQPIQTGTLIKSRVIGLLSTKDEKGTDDKIITVPATDVDPDYSKINSVDDLGEETLSRIQYFYKNYKITEPNKWVDINGIYSKAEAEKKLSDAIDYYHQNFDK